ncbi:uncharacterized protein LOC127136915 [Lathyrus oleraceus]|uniref:uncharacterized protein LOC127136915 n=1 Tax=Pisum sativum TaxID=3888 RepID=UPI0021D2ABB5|nr:uncharacterized protein LOC127136915 [Pisum sativum]
MEFVTSLIQEETTSPIEEETEACQGSSARTVRREKSQQVLEAPSPSGQEEPSTSVARDSPHATPSSSSSFSLPPHVSSFTDDDVNPVPPPEGEADADVEPETFGGGPVDFSLLPMYPYHSDRHIWDKEERDLQKFLNHMGKIVVLPLPNEDWFQSVLSLSGLKDLCMTDYTTVNHGMLNAFVER